MSGPARLAPGVVDAALYSDGVRVGSPVSLPGALEALREVEGGFAWIGMYRPTPEQLTLLGSEFDLHPLALEDAREAHQRPKLERYGDTLFLVLRPARYRDDVEEVELGEVHLFVVPDFALTLRHSESPDLSRIRSRLESSPSLLTKGPEAVLYAVLDAVVDGYAPVLAGLGVDVDEIEEQVFSGDPAASRRIYELSEEVLSLSRAVRPLPGILAGLSTGFEGYRTDDALRSYLRDVADHVDSLIERVDAFRVLLRDILTVNATLVAQRQNDELRELSEASVRQGEEARKVSAWAAILFAPTLVGTVYGMNFEVVPETEWVFGYPFALLLMLLVGFTLYWVFRRNRWL